MIKNREKLQPSVLNALKKLLDIDDVFEDIYEKKTKRLGQRYLHSDI